MAGSLSLSAAYRICPVLPAVEGSGAGSAGGAPLAGARHLPEVTHAGAAVGAGAAAGADVADGGGALVDEGADAFIGDPVADTDDHRSPHSMGQAPWLLLIMIMIFNIMVNQNTSLFNSSEPDAHIFTP
ncbi:MAG: hypothetical protein ACI8S6_003407 [Myxococcota bacterium]|jgi:hypothetical protein